MTTTHKLEIPSLQLNGKIETLTPLLTHKKTLLVTPLLNANFNPSLQSGLRR
jgi:hypothetical protein